MADFDLVVGASVATSTAEMKKDIKEIISKVNQKKYKIKVEIDIDDKKLKKLEKDIASMSLALSNTGNGAAKLEPAISSEVKEIERLARAAENAEQKITALNNAQRKSAGGTQDIGKQYASAQAKINSLINETRRQGGFTKAKNGSSSVYYKDTQNRQKQLLDAGALLETAFYTRDTDDESALREQIDVINKMLPEASAALKVNRREMENAGEATKSFGDRFGGLGKKFASWLGVSQIIMYAVRGVKQMIDASIELDSAFAQLKIVTGATDREMDRFAETTFNLSKSLGQSATDVAKSIETFSRLGYDLGDASSLAEYATILANTAAVSTDEATTGLTSIIKGYGMDVENAGRVADVLIKVGQEYAVSAGEMMEAYSKSGAALNAANTDFEKSAGLIAAANASVQDASTVGTALKTVSARIRGAKSELSELGEETEDIIGGAEAFSKYASEIRSITGFDIMKDAATNEYKDIYDIFEGVAGVWDKLSDTQQARVSEILGGTRQLQVISSIIGNWGDAAGAYESAMNSAGAATKANDIYMETATAHINQFKSQFQEMSTVLVSSGLISTIVDFGSTILKIVTWVGNALHKIGGLKTLLVSIAGIVISIKIEKIISHLETAFMWIRKIVTFLPRFVSGWRSASSQGVSGLNVLSSAFKAAGISASTLQAAIGGVTAVLSLGVAVYSFFNQKAEEASAAIIQSGKDAGAEAKSIADSVFALDDIRNKYQEGASSKEDLINATDSLISSLGAEGEAISGLSDGYDTYIDNLNEAAVLQLDEDIVDQVDGFKEAEKELKKAARGINDIRIRHNAGAFTGNNGVSTDPTEFGVPKEMLSRYTQIAQKFKEVEIFKNFATDSIRIDLDKFNFKTADGILDFYHTLKSIRSELLDSGLAGFEMDRRLKKWIDDIKEEAIEAESAIISLNASAANKIIFSKMRDYRNDKQDLPNTEKEFKEFRDGLVQSAIDSTEFAGSSEEVEDSIDVALSKIGSFKKFYQEVAESASNAAEKNRSLSDTLSNMVSIKNSMSALGDIYSDIVDGGDFDFSSLISEDFKNAFGELDGFNDFLSTISKHSDDVDKCTVAIKSLALEFISSKMATEDVNDENKKLIITHLKAVGVTNAEELAESALCEARKRSNIVAKTQNDLTVEQINDKYKEAAASNTLTEELALTLLQKIKLNAESIDSSNDIENLITLANAAKLSQKQIESLARAKALYSAAEDKRNLYKGLIAERKLKPGDADYTMMQMFLGRATVEMQEARDRISNLDITNGLFDIDDIRIDPGKLPISESGGSGKSEKTEAESAFEKEYARRQHMLNMEEITQKQYIDWLSGAYKNVYKDGTTEYWKYEEEVKKGLLEIKERAFKEQYDNHKHMVEMEQETQGDFLKWLRSAYKQTYVAGTEEYRKYAEEVKKGEEQITKDAESAINKIVDYEIDMLKKGAEKEKDNYQKRLDNLKSFYDKQKEMLRDQYDEEDYIAEQAKKRKAVTDLEMQISWMSMDDSAYAKKRIAELNQNLTDAREDLNNFEKEHSIDLADKMYDALYDQESAVVQHEIDAIDKMLNSPEALYNKALNDIKDNTQQTSESMLKAMILFNRMYGDGNDQTIVEMFKNAFESNAAYAALNGHGYKGIYIADPSMVSVASTSKSMAPTDVNGDSNINMKDILAAGKAIAGIDSNPLGLNMKDKLALRKYLAGLIDKDGVPMSLWDYISRTAGGYASGTKNSTPGLHRINERGSEVEFKSKNGNTYRMLGAGDMILPSKATSFLYDFAIAGSKIVGGITGSSVPSMIGAIAGGNKSIGITMSPITIYGNATHQTVSEMRKAQRDALNETLKAFSKLKT